MIELELGISLLATALVGYVAYTALLIAAHCRTIGGIADEARRVLRREGG